MPPAFELTKAQEDAAIKKINKLLLLPRQVPVPDPLGGVKDDVEIKMIERNQNTLQPFFALAIVQFAHIRRGLLIHTTKYQQADVECVFGPKYDAKISKWTIHSSRYSENMDRLLQQSTTIARFEQSQLYRFQSVVAESTAKLTFKPLERPRKSNLPHRDNRLFGFSIFSHWSKKLLEEAQRLGILTFDAKLLQSELKEAKEAYFPQKKIQSKRTTRQIES